jgi:hypothetical protein
VNEALETESQRYSAGKLYTFRHPVSAECIRDDNFVHQIKWERQSFSAGTYVRWNAKRQEHLLSGKPVEIDGFYLFYVQRLELLEEVSLLPIPIPALSELEIGSDT